MKRFLTATFLTLALLAFATPARAGSCGFCFGISWSFSFSNGCNGGSAFGGAPAEPTYFHIAVVPGSDYFPMIPIVGNQGGR